MKKLIKLLALSIIVSFLFAGCKKSDNSNNCSGVNIVVTATMNYAGTITVNVTGGVAPYQFSIDGSAFQAGNIFPNNYLDGSHTITVKDVNGCQGSALLTLTGNICYDARDGKYYPAVQIGTQIWLAKNINYTTPTGSFCLDDIPANCDTFGKLYYCDIAQGVCPNGWHVPTLTEVNVLLNFLGGVSNAYPHLIPGGSSGFNALFGGQRLPSGTYDAGRLWACFWASSEGVAGYGDAWSIRLNSTSVTTSMGSLYTNAYSVRCLKN